MAITKYDQFDFLIDIVPRCCISIYRYIYIARSDTYSGYYKSANSNILPSRDDIKPTTKREESSVRMVPDQVSWKNFEITFGYIKSF